MWDKLKDDLIFGNPLDWYSIEILEENQENLKKKIKMRNKCYRIVNEKYHNSLNSVNPVPTDVLYQLERSLNYMKYHGSLEAFQVKVLDNEIKQRKKVNSMLFQ